jgi:hypothetical protein
MPHSPPRTTAAATKEDRAMERIASAIVVVSITLAATASAQIADHLECYKVRDPQAKTSYTADLGGLVAEPGCLIRVPAKMACVPSTKTNVQPTPPGTGGSGTPNAFGCYKIKCPKSALPAVALNDQFGSRSVTPITPKLLCAPVTPPTTTTTMTTATTSTTTTTAGPTCANGGIPCGGACGGACGGTCIGLPLTSCAFLIHCGSAAPVCAAPVLGDPCAIDADCPQPMVCVTTADSVDQCPGAGNCMPPCPE